MDPEKARKLQGGRWKKGQSGNPAGKPKGCRNPALVMMDAMGDAAAEGVLLRLAEMAREGDLKAAQIILARVWPVRRPVLDLPRMESREDAAE